MSDRSTQTRARLLDAAEALFADHGYAAVGTREIADRAGANLASITYHFGSKRALYLDTVRRAMTRDDDGIDAWGRLAPVAHDREGAARQLAAFVGSHLESLAVETVPPPCMRLMLWEAFQPTEALDTVVREHIGPCRDALVAVVSRILPDADSATAAQGARSIIAQLFHQHTFHAFLPRLDGRPVDAAAVADHITRFSLRGLGCDDSFIESVIDHPVDALAERLT